MNPRYYALEIIGNRTHNGVVKENGSLTETFNSHVFTHAVMQKMLPRDVYTNLINTIEGKEKIRAEYADAIAHAMKEWACSLGATHYSHWFQPLTGAAAEKHDSFIEFKNRGQMIERLSGKQLIQGEPDASSFPSGGLRSTYEARGYTGWDLSSPAFIWSGGDGRVLCIPSVFCSWNGEALDTKIPLLRSDKKISDAVMRLLKLTGIKAKYVTSTLGCEQEYFLIDRAWRNLRPDLLLAGRTVFGASSPKGQELQDHYFGSVKDRVLAYMRDFEIAALKLGIPVKTRHNEVAPGQYEVAPVFEQLSLAVDHNILLMELMRQIATKHNFTCLLHEKPFHDINGSGKHCNWSLATDTGINLLDPTDKPGTNLHFLILLTAILHAVHEHSPLLRASIGSAANDFRLGGHEAPPAIISAYLGKGLEDVLEDFEKKGSHQRTEGKSSYDLGIHAIPDLFKDNTDRNRTSPFAFTGNKFEFRAVGSSASPAFPVTVLNVIVAESLNRIVDEIEKSLADKKGAAKSFTDAAVPVIRKYLRASRDIRFSGDNYGDDWITEAKKRKLPIVKKSIVAFEALKSEKTARVFEGVLTANELHSRYDISADIYSSHVNIESKLMVDIFRTIILPAALKYQEQLCANLISMQEATGKQPANQKKILQTICQQIESAIVAADALEKVSHDVQKISDPEKRGNAFCTKVLPKCEALREIVDCLESHVDDALWPLPKYREMLFLI
ncbi:MAG: glutamine synthetase III [Parachlamydiaceae bacterium]